jgi:hypothetical protein
MNYTRPMNLRFHLIVILVIGTASLRLQAQAPDKLQSPDGKYSVEIVRKALPGADQLIDFFTLVLSKREKAVTKVPTSGYLTAAHWSPNRKYVAVNNRRGNSGDYLWVFALPSGEVLKKPDDKIGEAWEKAAAQAVEKEFPAANDESFIRGWVTATGWKEGQLQFVVRARYRIDEGTFDFTGSADPANWAITSSKLSKSK